MIVEGHMKTFPLCQRGNERGIRMVKIIGLLYK